MNDLLTALPLQRSKKYKREHYASAYDKTYKLTVTYAFVLILFVFTVLYLSLIFKIL